jgi:hypothetical protein
MAFIYTSDSFLWETVTTAKAKALVKEGKEVYALYPDGGECLINATPMTYIMDATNDRSIKLAVEIGRPTNMCKVRADLIAQDLAPMVKANGKIKAFKSTELHDSFQPESLDGSEFNLLIVVNGRLISGSSIDFDFIGKVA